MLPSFLSVVAWDNRMDALPSVVRFNAKFPPRAPIQHAREWVKFHRPAA
jgi:glutathione S-transferase